ncbi:MAG: protein kinase domain-containing protein [Pirellula sp.]|jgi:hypothetical protein|nr:serine/threonine-protein kinase [Pirellula sp.]
MSDSSQELDAIIAQYLQAIESGQAISRDELFAKHPSHAVRLAEFLDDLDRVRDAADLPTQSVEEVVLRKPTPNAQSKVIAGRYKLLQKIGAGGMGEVWMADQLEPVKRRVALKLIKAGNNNDKIIARFEAERQALAMMDHPSIARVLDGGTTDDGQPYFVMELVQGLPITQYCDKHRLTIVARLQLFASICEAVHHAHQKGIIHRDLKPSNILVAVYNGKPVPKVIDFGLAKAWGNQPQLTEKTLFTEFGAVVGTLQYMSPEQAELDAVDVDTRADIYALGVLLYELLTGSTPIERETLEQQAVLRVLQSIRETDPPRPSARLSSAGNRLSDISSQRQIDSNKLQSELKGDLDWIVMKALEKDRSRRYESATSFSNDVQRYLAGDAIEARPPTWRYRFGKAVRRNRFVVTVASLFAIFLLAASAVSSILAIRAMISEEKATQKEQVALAETSKAREAEKVAKEAREDEAKQREKSELYLYRSNVQLAMAKIEEGSLDLAHKLLSQTPERLRNIEYWHAESMLDQSRLVLRGHEGTVYCECFSPDGKLLASGGQDETIRIWDVGTGREVKVLKGHDSPVTNVCFTEDGRELWSCTSAENSLLVWDIESASVKAKVPIGSVGFICCSPDGNRVAVAQQKSDEEFNFEDFIVILNASTFQEVSKCRGFLNNIGGVHFSPDGREVYTGSYVHTQRWDADSGKPLSQTAAEGEQRINFVKPFQNGQAVLSSSDYEGVIRLLNPLTLGAEKTWQLPHREIHSLCLDQNDRFLFYAGKDRAIHRTDGTIDC